MTPPGGTLVLGMAKVMGVTQSWTVPVWGSILPKSLHDAKGTMVGCKPEQAQYFAGPQISIDFG